MRQFAVFVDAGYLCKAGGALVAGCPVNRRNVELKITPLMEQIISTARELSSDRPLLRIYWYDGCPNGTRKSAEHSVIEHQPDVKLRLGTINKEGQQKGVDTALVLDLVELAQNRAISDAVILGGDEDLHGGVLKAQALGVRVHILGVNGGEHANQSYSMLAEADRTATWNLDTVKAFITVKPEEYATLEAPISSEPDIIDPALIKAAIDGAQRANLRDVLMYWKVYDRGLPGDIDGRLLASARQLLGRNLDGQEKRTLRDLHTEEIKKRVLGEGFVLDGTDDTPPSIEAEAPQPSVDQA